MTNHLLARPQWIVECCILPSHQRCENCKRCPNCTRRWCRTPTIGCCLLIPPSLACDDSQSQDHSLYSSPAGVSRKLPLESAAKSADRTHQQYLTPWLIEAAMTLAGILSPTLDSGDALLARQSQYRYTAGTSSHRNRWVPRAWSSAWCRRGVRCIGPLLTNLCQLLRGGLRHHQIRGGIRKHGHKPKLQ